MKEEKQEFVNLNSGSDKKLRNNTIILVITVIAVLVIIAGLYLLNQNNKEEDKPVDQPSNVTSVEEESKTVSLNCEKNGKMLKQSITYNFTDEKIDTVKFYYEIDQTVSDDDLTTAELTDLTSFAFLQFAVSEITDPGLNYTYDEETPISHVTMEIDLSKATSDDVKDLVIPEDGNQSVESVRNLFVQEGYTCK